jgi:hypothetical protein
MAARDINFNFDVNETICGNPGIKLLLEENSLCTFTGFNELHFSFEVSIRFNTHWNPVKMMIEAISSQVRVIACK